ncbi:MAG: hypothetical protein M3122_06935 [Actinomycetota bacterium]|nr:hypothetical protein [Actinomycetota bacterium]
MPGGAEEADEAPGLTFPQGGAQTLLRIGGGDSRIFINSAHGYHPWLYGYKSSVFREPEDAANVGAGEFVPWKLMLNQPLREDFITFYVDGEPMQEYEGGLPEERMKLYVNTWFPTWLHGEELNSDRYTYVDWIEH